MDRPGDALGPPYIGVIVDCIFLGMLFCQVPSYFKTFPGDPGWIKRLVVIVTILSITKSIISVLYVWDVNIVGFGNWEVVAAVPWHLWIEAPASTLMSSCAQSFFVWRCFTLTNRNWYLLWALTAMILTALGSSMAMGAQYATDPGDDKRLTIVGVPMVVFGILADLTITSVVSFKLVQSQKGFSRQTDNALKRLLAVTWEAAAPPAASQLLNLFLYLAMRRENSWHLTLNMLTPRLYIFSLMYSLNSRATILAQSLQRPTAQDTSQPTGGHSFRTRMTTLTTQTSDKKDKSGNGTTGTIPVHVQTDTLVHEDAYMKGLVQSAIVHEGHELKVRAPGQYGKSEDSESLDSSRWEIHDKVKVDPAEDEGLPYDRYNPGVRVPGSKV